MAVLAACGGDDGSGEGETSTDDTTSATVDDDTATLTNPSEATNPETSGDSLDGSETSTTPGTEDGGSGTSGTGDEGSGETQTGDSTGTGDETGPMGCAEAQNEGMCSMMKGCLWVGAMGDAVCTSIDEVECADVTNAEACAVLPDCVWNVRTETCDPE
jgi:hypothetical protein